MSNTKEYILPNGKKAVFEYDGCGIGKITLECMDELMGMIADRPQGEWIYIDEPIIGNPYGRYKCSECNLEEPFESDFCPHCGARMKGANDDR